MFDRLPESRRRRERRIAATTTSVAAHAAIVLLAVVATSRADPPDAAPVPVDPLIWIDAMPTPPEGVWRAGGSNGRSSRRPPAPTELVPGPIVIDVDTPAPDDRPWFDIESVLDRHGPLVPGDSSARGSGTLSPGGVFTRASVERVASLRAGGPTPRYPEPRRAAGLAGRVDLRFVVDTLGRVEPGTSTVLASSDPRFTAAVRDVLPRLRFAPATAGGRRVRMMVEMPFVFRIERR